MNELKDFVAAKQRAADSKNTYTIMIPCMNCGQTFSATLQKGVPVMQADPSCPNCGMSPKVMSELWGNRR